MEEGRRRRAFRPPRRPKIRAAGGELHTEAERWTCGRRPPVGGCSGSADQSGQCLGEERTSVRPPGKQGAVFERGTYLGARPGRRCVGRGAWLTDDGGTRRAGRDSWNHQPSGEDAAMSRWIVQRQGGACQTQLLNASMMMGDDDARAIRRDPELRNRASSVAGRMRRRGHVGERHVLPDRRERSTYCTRFCGTLITCDHGLVFFFSPFPPPSLLLSR